MQTEHGDGCGREFTSAKLELRKRLDDLRAELDRYLASEYDVKTKDQKAYGQWRGSHQPFPLVRGILRHYARWWI